MSANPPNLRYQNKQQEQYQAKSRLYNEAVIPKQPIQNLSDYILDKLSQFELRLQHNEQQLRIQDELLRLKKEEKENSKDIIESQYEEIFARNQNLEKRVSTIELEIKNLEVHLSHTTPVQITKSFEKANSRIEKLRDEIEDKLASNFNIEQKQLVDLKESVDQQTQSLRITFEAKLSKG